MLPEGKVLRHAGRSRGGIVMKLYKDAPDETDWNRIRLTAIHQLTAVDEIIDALARDLYVVKVSAEARPQALELVRHLAQAARSRGNRLVLNTRPARPVLSLVIDGAELTVTIDEVGAQVPHVLTDEERRRKKREPWIRPSTTGCRPDGSPLGEPRKLLSHELRIVVACQVVQRRST